MHAHRPGAPAQAGVTTDRAAHHVHAAAELVRAGLERRELDDDGLARRQLALEIERTEARVMLTSRRF
jgi:hypothetical protein